MARSRLAVAGHRASGLVVAQADELRVTQRPAARPLDKRHLDHRPRRDPRESLHVLRGHPFAPVRASRAVRQVAERRGGARAVGDPREDLGARVRGEARPHFAGKQQPFAVVAADEDRIEAGAGRLVAADDEFLLQMQLIGIKFIKSPKNSVQALLLIFCLNPWKTILKL